MVLTMAMRLYWLSVTIAFLIIFIVFTSKLIAKQKLNYFKKILNGIYAFLLILFTVLSIKLFMWEVYKIPSSSMENTLLTNDIILVNKLKYGPRLPQSPFDIPLVNIAYYFNANAKKRMHENGWPYRRLSGTTTIKQGDVFVFNSTWRKEFVIVKRCVALPGDTLSIINSEIYTNKSRFKEPFAVKNIYRFKTRDKTNLNKALDSLNISPFSNSGYGKLNEAVLTRAQLNFLKSKGLIDSVAKKIDSFVPDNTFVKLKRLRWTFDNMGPLIVPKKGMQIKLDEKTFALYQRAINSSEGCEIREESGLYYVDNKMAKQYTFKQDYYFMMGDNRKETLDSRRWGFVPESNIIGKVECVLYSNYGGEFNWKRLLKQ